MDDSNVTNHKFSGNPTRSYRSPKPLRVTGEVARWEGRGAEVLKAMTGGIEEAKRLGIERIG